MGVEAANVIIRIAECFNVILKKALIFAFNATNSHAIKRILMTILKEDGC
jgi:hypothetical protein